MERLPDQAKHPLALSEYTNMKSKPRAASIRKFISNPPGFAKVQRVSKRQAIFSQGEPAGSVMYIQKGSVKFTVTNESGKEAVVAIFGLGVFRRGGMSGRRFVWGRRPHRADYSSYYWK